jgi:23S rRNA pseudouridine1911/1915/1917 synthase
MSFEYYDFCVLSLPGQKRVDQYISDDAKICSRNQLKQRLESLRVNGTAVRLSRQVRREDRIELVLRTPPALEISPEEIPLDILYEDDQVIVLNKPQGLVVHPAPGNYSGTLVHGLLFYGGKETETQDHRPGIVHRLDKDTSGVLITAKNEKAHQFLAAQFQQKSTRKEYLALCRGRIEPETGKIENNLGRSERNRQRFTVVPSGGKASLTAFQVLRRWKRVTFVRLKPRTGRTHQLRVHMRHIGHPILGDPLYGHGGQDGCTLMLHAFSLTIVLPGESGTRTFRAALPPRFAEIIRGLNSDERNSG